MRCSRRAAPMRSGRWRCARAKQQVRFCQSLSKMSRAVGCDVVVLYTELRHHFISKVYRVYHLPQHWYHQYNDSVEVERCSRH
jgi:hypothetical protein